MSCLCCCLLRPEPKTIILQGSSLGIFTSISGFVIEILAPEFKAVFISSVLEISLLPVYVQNLVLYETENKNVHTDKHVHNYSETIKTNYTVRNYYNMLNYVSSKFSAEEFINLILTALTNNAQSLTLTVELLYKIHFM
jgi:hypothetical protein